MVWFESFSDPTQAIMIEKQIKGWSRRKKEALINEDWDKLVEYSKNYTETVLVYELPVLSRTFEQVLYALNSIVACFSSFASSLQA